MIHRDVKPGNILLDSQHRPKLTDFDLVRAADTTGGTRTGLGTFLYAAPEAMNAGTEAGKPADVYGLGMTALFVLHGGDLPSEILWDLPDFLSKLKIGNAARNILARALARKATERWSSVAEFIGALGVADSVFAELDVLSVLTGEPFTEPLTGEVFLPVPAGRFEMGSTAESREQPVYWVRLSGFWLARTPVTNRQYRVFLEATKHPEPARWRDRQYSGPDQPVVGISWEDAMAYCSWLSKKSPAGGSFSLPTEAQWEYSSRGTDGREYPWGKQRPDKSRANFDESGIGRPSAVGSYPSGAGPFGHLDLAGNVWEWCLDFWEKDYERWSGGEPLDPVGEADASFRPLRGGSWLDGASYLRSAYRIRDWPSGRSDDIGFRLSWFPSSTVS